VVFFLAQVCLPVVQTKDFGKPGYNLGNYPCEAPDVQDLVAGTLHFDAAVIKENAKIGIMIWSKTWNLGSEDSFESLCVNKQDEVFATGYRNGLGEGTFFNWGKVWS